MIPVIGSVVTAFFDSNLAGQFIVILLIVFSIMAWTVMMGKYNQLKGMRDYNLRYQRYLAQLPAVLQAQRNVKGAYATLTREAIEAYERSSGSIPEVRIGMVENALQRSIGDCVTAYESKMVWLASIVTGAPFFGLLGTVWGVMDSFGALATEKTATIQMLAPGVSGALLTTVCGLLVAIPSVFGYNYLLSQSKIMVTELENFASSLADRIELEVRDGTEGRAQ
ncbi:MAG: MotA/TolQ/ExbB proton channel family protein [Opitutales bacterium]|nr:MotA/TolQ/ExbB proton channel family protein [Opitutales bacterium]